MRAFLTGCGAVSPFGGGVEALWTALCEGRSAVAPLRGIAVDGLAGVLAAEVPPDAVAAYLSHPERAHLERIDQHALAAARAALADAGLELGGCDPNRIAVVVGTTLGAMPIGEGYLRARQGGTAFDARRLLGMPYAATAARLARTLGVRGPVLSPSIACASGTLAVGLARDLVALDRADVVLAGGAEALCEFVVAGFACLRATTATAVRPFDARRDGLALGEGAALVVVESARHAARRGATAAIEVAGSGLSADAVHMTAPARDGAGAARAMRAALADAGLDADAVDVVSAHGTATVFNDAMEMAALAAVFGDHRPPVSGIKGAIGHTLAAAGAFEAVLCARVLRHGVVPPTAGCEELDPACALDIVRGAPRRVRASVALSTSSAFAGNNAAVVLRRDER
ncbi:beta-ketoacyl-[acyl-carrier-protein] synthase family protein [bacterium]|nr:beta-ketoacyl-[acyl-carrier-protein] synthase family protein [bacterium]